ncbi:Mitochondrial inner membrane protein oxa1 [Xylographa opegraphella]|nr:Mitochondrial inner membrane protein oxa1 [Xylographa opegraphella]
MSSGTEHDAQDLTESSLTIPSDSENYDANNELSPSPPSSSSSPIILYSPPTIWSLLRGAAINVLLPFINGLMLGFGELFAHEAAFRLGWSGTKLSSQVLKHNRIAQSRSVLGQSSLQLWRTTTISQQTCIRFASTVPVPTKIPTPEAVVESTAPSSQGVLQDDWAASLDSLTTTDLLPLEEHIGYLKAMGLDYGWGPTAMMEYILEHVHVWTQTPWWASIILSAFLVRLALFKLNVNAADQAGRLARATPQIKPIQDKIKTARDTRDTHTMMVLSSQMKTIMKAEGVSYLKLLGPFLQIPLGYGTFRLLQGMSSLPVPGLDTGGILWIRDLTVADPYYTLPMLTSVMMYYTFKRGGETGSSNAATMSPTMKHAFTYGLPMMSFLFMSFWPACVQLTFTTTSIIALGTATLFRHSGIRTFLGISDLPMPQAATDSGPYKGVMNVYQPPSANAEVVEEPKGVLGGAVADIKGAAKNVIGSARSYQERKSKSGGGRLTAGELRRAKAYEDKRRRELEIEKWGADRRRSGSRI